jgi:UDP-N-acetylmuramoyl-L-alanyl-D-glutamate--2,6-diaminopimelate ligase
MSIGTLGVRSNHKTILDFGLTSPSLIDLRKYLNIYGKDKDFCVLEASSHALMQSRLFGLEFEMGGWLSFSQDHLDYHKTMEEYFAAKALITNYVKDSGKIFVPSSQSDLFNKISRVTSKVQKARVIEQTLPLFFSTNFNRNNLEVAVDMVECGFNIVVPDIFHKIIPPDGRFYIKPFRTNFIVVDFAHTPDALDNICQGIRAAFPKHRLKVLFGCGGDRDRTKRPLMGKIAETWGNEIYVTSDNPRSEDPEQIIDEIVQGMSTKMIYKITERPKAVQTAFSELKENEILLLAGKGHEDYILIKGVKHPYSDIGEVEKFLARKNV